MYNVPVGVAVTTALAQGGVFFGSASPTPPGAVPIDAPVDRRLVTVGPGASTTITLTAVPANKAGTITAIGISTDDVVNTRITTRVNGISVPPLQAVLGAVGTLENPTPVPAPINLSPGDVFSILIENIGAGNINVAGRVLGWRTA